MEDEFKIYIERLRKGDETIEESLDPAFLAIDEKDLDFPEKVKIDGEAYLADDDLVLHLNVETTANIPCSICNEKVNIGIKLQDFYYSEPIADIKSGVFNYKEILREAILLDTPFFAECNEGNCSKRKELGKFLKEPSKEIANDEGYQPFADLK